jgi:PAP2 superfamily
MIKKLIFIFLQVFLLNTISYAQIDSTNNDPKFLKAVLPSSILIGIGAHGGTRALSHDYIVDANNQLIYKKNKWNERSNVFPAKFHVEDYIWALPAGAYMLGNYLGLKPKNNFKQRFVLATSAYVVTGVVTLSLKNIVKEPRPSDSKALVSWPSGHTSGAFTGATLLHLEYGKKYPWLSVGGFAIASLVGSLRILNNKHAMNDVIAGAGIGILSTSLVYYIHEKIKTRKRKSL